MSLAAITQENQNRILNKYLKYVRGVIVYYATKLTSQISTEAQDAEGVKRKRAAYQNPNVFL